MNRTTYSGILPIDKSAGCTSFDLVTLLRKKTKEKTIGHAGTLDPIATGVMVLLIGSKYTKQSADFSAQDKEYEATLLLGASTNTYDREGSITEESTVIPTLDEINLALSLFQGTITQIPPMFSAKKQNGKKLYEYARKGIEIERPPIQVTLKTTLQSYAYPLLKLHIACSKGTYIRTLAHDLGIHLKCFAHLTELRRTRSGSFSLEQCIAQDKILDPETDLTPYIIE